MDQESTVKAHEEWTLDQNEDNKIWIKVKVTVRDPKNPNKILINGNADEENEKNVELWIIWQYRNI